MGGKVTSMIDEPDRESVSACINAAITSLAQRRKEALAQVRAIDRERDGLRKEVLKALNGTDRNISEQSRKRMSLAAKKRWIARKKRGAK